MHDLFFVYILTNPGGTVLYVGVTNDLCRRVDHGMSPFPTVVPKDRSRFGDVQAILSRLPDPA